MRSYLKHKPSKKNVVVPWWNDTCNQAVHPHNPLEGNTINYKRLRVGARRTLKDGEGRRKAGINFFSTLGKRKELKKVMGFGALNGRGVQDTYSCNTTI